ncbi:MAG: MBL fold metallo-hydrolase [Nodosilinea sp. WJT8-NPBG4]|jgi:glyoxylase-like metal-dependent hydrolase (beta-lactamase superfamily II)|nr:MBL fold metallo-hydrolase [Nodosilinea sp. WJT8-NPBG4]
MALVATATLGFCLWLGGPHWPSSTALAQAQPAVERATPTNATAYRFTVGDYRAMVVSDGTLTFPVGFFVPNADPEAAAAALTDNFLPTDNVLAHLNVLYLETDEHKVLIDTGAGNTFGPTVGYLANNLAAVGIAPNTIDTIIITHAHPDHIGGILDDSGNPVFANANYYISETEWDFWTAPTVAMPNSLVDADTQATTVAVAQEWLGAIASRTTRFALGDEIIPGVVSVPSVGHTPGQASYLITSGDDSLLAMGDVFFSDPLNLENPDWEVAFDTDPTQGVATRKQLLETVTGDRRRLLVPHMPFPGIGHVRAQGDAYGWEPIVWDFGFEP